VNALVDEAARPGGESSSILDEAYERLSATGFELPNGFVNHGPMACEALAALGLVDDVAEWSRRYGGLGGRQIDPVLPSDFHFDVALGDFSRLPDWIGYFDREIDERGWRDVVSSSVPRLLPALSTALFHGAIRAGHAVRAIAAIDTAPRRAELARSLAYWAARFRPGEPTSPVEREHQPAEAIARAAAFGARCFVSQPNIFNLHGVTGAMAVELFVGHIPDDAVGAGLAQIAAEHAALYRSTRPAIEIVVAGAPIDVLADAAAASSDSHEVKLVEACRRGYQTTGDLAFIAAAEAVTGYS
jgi:hypothetical protein